MRYPLPSKIIQLSESKNWDDAKKEWRVIEIYKDPGFQTCLCGHYPIKEIVKIENIHNSNKVIVGNCCINRFFGDSKYNKVFDALKRKKINRALLDLAYSDNFISEKEYDFGCNVLEKENTHSKTIELVCFSK